MKYMLILSRAITLFIHSCSEHSNITSLKAVEYQFLSIKHNITFSLLDQGIFKNFKKT